MVEALNEDFNALKKALKMDSEISLPKDDVATHRSPVGMSKFLSEKAERNIRSWYQEGIELYQFC